MLHFRKKSRSINKVLLKFKQSFYTVILIFRKFTQSLLLLDFKDLKYKRSILKVYFPYSFFCKGTFSDYSSLLRLDKITE